MPVDNIFSSGHQITLKMGGQQVGSARSCSCRQDFGNESAYVIGSNTPVENIPQRWSGTIDLDKFYVRKRVGMAGNIDVSSEGVLNVDLIDIEIIDKKSQVTVFAAQGCSLTSSDITINANAFTGERATMVALRVVREDATQGNAILPSGI